MKHKLTYTDNYILIVDDSEIKEGDFVLSKLLEINIFGKYFDASLYKKIIAHLPLNNSTILEGVPLLPPLEVEDDVEKLAHYEYRVNLQPNGRTLAGGKYDVDINYESRIGFTKGYNKAKEKYKYTKEDMVRMAIYCWNIASKPTYGATYNVNKIAEEYIQSLSQPILPKAFECEVEAYTVGEMSKLPLGTRNEKPKTTTNAQGQIQWVGNWVHES